MWAFGWLCINLLVGYLTTRLGWVHKMTEQDEEQKAKLSSNPFDLDGLQFNSEMYMQKLLKVRILIGL